MSIDSCIFCTIIKRKIPVDPILETDLTLVIKDINPQAPTHYLVMPKKHIEHFGFLEKQDAHHIADMGMVIAELGKSIAKPQAFNVIVNNGIEAGQSVLHLHWHFLAGKNLYTTGLKL